MDFTVALIGAGNMGGALLRGWISNGLEATNVVVIDPSPREEMQQLMDETGVGHAVSPETQNPVDVIVLAVKPQVMNTVLPTLAPLVGDQTVAVSVAAGKTIGEMSEMMNGVPIIRTMPNTPSLVSRGITVACPGAGVTQTHRMQVQELLSATGKLEWVEEEGLIDAVTAVSGSGPAYVFYLAECMAEAGVKAGLSRQLAETLARETVCGAGELLYQSDDNPDTLRKNVTSPGGTTAAALGVLMAEDGMMPIVERAVAAAKKRSEELS